VMQVENHHSALQVSSITGKKVANDYAGEASDYDYATIDQLDQQTDFGKQFVYGTTNRQLLREATSTDPLNLLLDQDEPYIVTKDLFFDDLVSVKEIDQMTIHAEFDPITCKGIEVGISARNELNEEVVFEAYPELWTPSMPTMNLSGPRKAARVFRFKFTFKKALNMKCVRDAAFYGWAEHALYKSRDGQPLQMVK